MNCQEKLESLSSLLEQSISEQYFSGAVVGVFQEGACCSRAWGTTAMQGEQLLTSHLFDLASLSKLFTTAAILRLIDSGVISDQTRLLDVFLLCDPVITTHLNKVSVADLLTHASGLQAWYPFYTRRSDSFEVILHDLLFSTPLQQGVVYSDINFMLLGLLVSKVTGLPLDEAMATLVFNPLKMKNATYHPQPAQCVATEFGNRIEKRMVAELGLQFSDWRCEHVPLRGQCNDGNGFYYFGGVAGHAGIFADVSDVLALGRAFMPSSNSFFSSVVLERTLHDWGGGRGYGVQFGDLYPDNGFGHTGFTGTYLYVNPLRDMVVVLLTNRLHTPNVRSINHIRIEVVKRLLVQ
jgi:CubicO group peptidase (beta-lactamase class C family)